jgi:hypothetical protein
VSIHLWGSTMNERDNDLEQDGEDILTSTVSDEYLEVAGGGDKMACPSWGLCSAISCIVEV